MPILTRQRLFGFKAEATLGTAESLTNAECTSNIIEPDIAPTIGFTDIPAQSGLGQRAGVHQARGGSATFQLHACGKGSSGVPAWSDLLKACGCSLNTATFSPSANNGTGATMGKWEGSGATARFKSIVGAMGNAVWRFNAGQIVPIQFDFSGLWVAPSTATPPTVTHQTTTPPRFASATFTVGGTAYQISDLEFDMGNSTILREDPQTIQGYKSAWITDRRPVIRFAPEALNLGTGGKDWFADFLSGTTAQIVITLGTASNNTITITAPACQLVSPPTTGDRNGILTDVLEWRLNQNSDTEDSEYTIVFS